MLQKSTSLLIGISLMLSFQSLCFAENKAVLDEISHLKSVISNLDERLKRLENNTTIKSLVPAPELATPVTHETKKEFFGWKDKNAWTQIKDNMSESQVESILGHPIRIDEMGKGFKRLFYHGEVIGSGIISGYVEIYENQVSAIHFPEFQ